MMVKNFWLERADDRKKEKNKQVINNIAEMVNSQLKALKKFQSKWKKP